MIDSFQLQKVLDGYDASNLMIGVLGGHSALDVCRGAKKHGFRTLVVAQKGREKTYEQYYRSQGGGVFAEKYGGRQGGDGFPARGDRRNCCGRHGGFSGGSAASHGTEFSGASGCVDEVLVLDSFSDITRSDVQEQLRALNVIFIHNRYFWVYCDFAKIEEEFLVPIYGTRSAVKLEERNVPGNQYSMLSQAGIRMPRLFASPREIDRLAIVKVNEALRKYERAFFIVSSFEEYECEGAARVARGEIDARDLENAVIEEYIIGAQINVNFFNSVMRAVDGHSGLELMGTDIRRQTNLDGILRLPSWEQAMIPADFQKALRIETGHIAVTAKESLLEKFFDAGEKFAHMMNEKVPPGMIGPFALQGAIACDEGREEFVVFDVSMRIPGSPGTLFTPYSGYLWGESMSYGERIAKEISEAAKAGRLGEIVT